LNTFLKADYGKNRLTPAQIFSDPVLFLAFGFGSGLARKAPGTFGTLAAVPIYCILAQTGNLFYSIVTLTITLAGIWICGQAADKLGEHDFGGIVWDEIAGYLITLWWLPFSWQGMVLGFIIFRIFDILKPWPIKIADRKVKGGFGIMLDDVLAGVLAAIVVRIVLGYLS
jgi:phosphatidylglycerophosphatase A